MWATNNSWKTSVERNATHTHNETNTLESSEDEVVFVAEYNHSGGDVNNNNDTKSHISSQYEERRNDIPIQHDDDTNGLHGSVNSVIVVDDSVGENSDSAAEGEDASSSVETKAENSVSNLVGDENAEPKITSPTQDAKDTISGDSVLWYVDKLGARADIAETKCFEYDTVEGPSTILYNDSARNREEAECKYELQITGKQAIEIKDKNDDSIAYQKEIERAGKRKAIKVQDSIQYPAMEWSHNNLGDDVAGPAEQTYYTCASSAEQGGVGPGSAGVAGERQRLAAFEQSPKRVIEISDSEDQAEDSLTQSPARCNDDYDQAEPNTPEGSPPPSSTSEFKLEKDESRSDSYKQFDMNTEDRVDQQQVEASDRIEMQRQMLEKAFKASISDMQTQKKLAIDSDLERAIEESRKLHEREKATRASLSTLKNQLVHVYIDFWNISLGFERSPDQCMSPANLVKEVEAGRTAIKRMVFGSKTVREGRNQNISGSTLGRIWREFEDANYDVHLCERRPGQGEQFVDDAIIAQIYDDLLAYTSSERVLVLLTGDGNDNDGRASFFQCITRALNLQNWRVELWSWKRSTSYLYKQLEKDYAQNDKFNLIFLDAFYNNIIKRKEGSKRKRDNNENYTRDTRPRILERNDSSRDSNRFAIQYRNENQRGYGQNNSDNRATPQTQSDHTNREPRIHRSASSNREPRTHSSNNKDTEQSPRIQNILRDTRQQSHRDSRQQSTRAQRKPRVNESSQSDTLVVQFHGNGDQTITDKSKNTSTVHQPSKNNENY
eukprot:m.343507 g.343507  ORF g.343507 m.343507 type:complete len:780 (+) comp22944_c0_seq1:172-2511(+)